MVKENMNGTTIVQQYVAPQIEVIEVEVEKGYTLSGRGNDSDDSEFFGPSPTY